VSAGRILDVHLDLLDKQVVDSEGRMCGKVDDAELTREADGTTLVTALLIGPIALAPRFGGRIGTWLVSLARHTAGDLERQPHRVVMAHVIEIDSVIKLDATRFDLDLVQGDQWVADHIIGRLPGADHASE
jgi:sporulation protein YlmC with PRC-barrel domain